MGFRPQLVITDPVCVVILQSPGCEKQQANNSISFSLSLIFFPANSETNTKGVRCASFFCYRSILKHRLTLGSHFGPRSTSCYP